MLLFVSVRTKHRLSEISQELHNSVKVIFIIKSDDIIAWCCAKVKWKLHESCLNLHYIL